MEKVERKTIEGRGNGYGGKKKGHGRGRDNGLEEGKRRVLEEGKNGGIENSERGEREKDERQKEVPEEGGHAEGGVRDVKGGLSHSPPKFKTYLWLS